MKYKYILQSGNPWKHYAKWKKSVTKGHVLYDLMCMKHPE